METGGVLINRSGDVAMQEYTEPLSTTFLGMEEDLRQEFETRIREYSTLAFRVAYGVLRNREDAEDVTQEAFAKAYKTFAGLRDRERFRAWIVRIAWRMALDHQRSRLRRTAREGIHASNRAVAGGVAEPGRTAELWRATKTTVESTFTINSDGNNDKSEYRHRRDRIGAPA